MKRISEFFLTGVIACFGMCASLSAQGTAQISGIVSDPTGARRFDPTKDNCFLGSAWRSDNPESR